MVVLKITEQQTDLFVFVSVKHVGGWLDGAYTYRNEFSCIRAEKGIYAPPLRTPIPRIDGVTTALVGATGDLAPTLNEYGHYNVNMPFVLEEKQNRVGDYGGSKDIRLAQPSSGMSDGKTYGFHFPAKRGAEMVLAYVDGNPDRPLGLGFVPNAASPSVIRNTNLAENVMRTWGGNELVMDDTHDNKNVKMSTPGERYLELHDGEKLVRVKSENSEQVFNDAEKYAKINVGRHTIHINYKSSEGDITIKTAKGNEIEMNDSDDKITVQNASEEGGEKINKLVLNGEEKKIILDSNDNAITLNGKDNRIAIESGNNEFVIDGKKKKIALAANKDNSLVLDSENNSISLNAKNNIIIRAGGKIVIDAKGGILTKGQKIEFSPAGTGETGSGNDQSTQNLQNNTTVTTATVGVASATTEDTMSTGEDEKPPTTNENEEITPTNTTENEPKIIETRWSYGENHNPLSKPKKSRYYKDLNLYVKTKNYNDGDSVNITLKRQDGKPLFKKVYTIELSGKAYNNELMFENILKNYTLNQS